MGSPVTKLNIGFNAGALHTQSLARSAGAACLQSAQNFFGGCIPIGIMSGSIIAIPFLAAQEPRKQFLGTPRRGLR